MNSEIEQILEFDKIKDEIKKYCASKLGRDLVDDLRPSDDIEQIRHLLYLCQEGKSIVERYGGLPFEGLYDIRPAIKFAEVSGTTLEPEDLIKIVSTVKVAENIRKFFDNIPEECPIIRKIVQDLRTFKHLEEAVNRCIGKNGEILDDASPELSRIRRRIATVREKITAHLESILRSPQYQPYIQESLITLRNNRYVIPIKQTLKGNIPGVVQDRSASGLTSFIEPASVIDMNNELQELINDEVDEIKRVLRGLTDLVRDSLCDLEKTLRIIAELDFINAKARFCVNLVTAMPVLNDRGYINLIQARHPVLQLKLSRDAEIKRSEAQENDAERSMPKKLVPIDFHIGDGFNTLVITGPNTGGKTVALKTIGLLTLMMQSGLHVPAKEGSVMAVFKEVFADIGDEQSIEQNLSTFSSHITRIIRIIESLDRSSLVLLDELGAGTEPSEGAALGMAILDYLHSKGVRTIATTHHDALKAHAYMSEGMENASVAFDINTLQPTYELQIGMPGSSNALVIAERLGLPKEIVESAKGYLNPEAVKMTDLLMTVQDMQRELQLQRNLMEEKLLKASKAQQEHEQILKQLKDKGKDIEREALNKAAAIIRQAKLLVENIVSEVKVEKASSESVKRARRSLAEAGRQINSAIAELSESEPYGQGEEMRNAVEVSKLKVGDEVYIKTLNNRGVLLTTPDARGRVQVGIGKARVTVDASDLMIICNESKSDESLKPSLIGKKVDVPNFLDLRGYRAEEALSKTDKYLDDATVAGLESVSIIHGIGTGALRSAIRELLSEHPLVASFRSGSKEEGGPGVTVVQLR